MLVLLEFYTYLMASILFTESKMANVVVIIR